MLFARLLELYRKSQNKRFPTDFWHQGVAIWDDIQMENDQNSVFVL